MAVAGIVARKHAKDRMEEDNGSDAIFAADLKKQEAAEALRKAKADASRELREMIEAEERAEQSVLEARDAIQMAEDEEAQAQEAKLKAEAEEEAAKVAQQAAVVEQQEADEARQEGEEAERLAAQACAEAEKEMLDVKLVEEDLKLKEAALEKAKAGGKAEEVEEAEKLVNEAKERLEREKAEARDAIEKADFKRASAMESIAIAKKEKAEADDAIQAAEKKRVEAAEERQRATVERKEAEDAKEDAKKKYQKAESDKKEAARERKEYEDTEKERKVAERKAKEERDRVYRTEWVKGPQELKQNDDIHREIYDVLCEKLNPPKKKSLSRSEQRKIEFMKKHLHRRAQDMHDDLHFLTECYRMLDCGSMAVIPEDERDAQDDERTWKRLGRDELRLWLCVLSHGESPTDEEVDDAMTQIFEHRTAPRPVRDPKEEARLDSGSSARKDADPSKWSSPHAGKVLSTPPGSTQPYGISFIDFLVVTFDFYVALGPEPLRATYIDLLLT